MNDELRALIPSKGLIFSTLLVLAGILWFVISPGEKRSSNPFNTNYDAALNNSGPKLRRVHKIEVVTERVDQNGVTHQTVH